MAFVIALEGLPGAGKTTLAEKIAALARKEGLSVEIPDVETAIPETRTLRKIAAKMPVGSKGRSLIFLCFRRQQAQITQEFFKKADVVIMDRHFGPAVVYDHLVGEVPIEIIKWVVTGIKKPNVVFFLDAPLGVVLGRKKARTLADEQLAKKIERAYRRLARKLR